MFVRTISIKKTEILFDERTTQHCYDILQYHPISVHHHASYGAYKLIH